MSLVARRSSPAPASCALFALPLSAGSFNLKYGNYGTGAPTKVTWRNVSW
jgi:hypothetical protein